jgi:hypothetical protein
MNQNNRSMFNPGPFSGMPQNQVRLGVELHDEMDINHVMACAKCKKKKRRQQQQQPPSQMV